MQLFLLLSPWKREKAVQNYKRKIIAVFFVMNFLLKLPEAMSGLEVVLDVYV